MSARPNLAALVVRWQEILRLRDWNITTGYVPRLAGPDGRQVAALSTIFVDAKNARIDVCDPSTAPAGDIEETLVGELLRLHFAPLAQGTRSGAIAEGFAVGAIASAMTHARSAQVRASLVHQLVGTLNRTAPAGRSHTKKETDMSQRNHALAEIDRRMGLGNNSTQAVGRHPISGRLQISNLAPIAAGAARGARVARFGVSRRAAAGLPQEHFDGLRADFPFLENVDDEEIARLAKALAAASSGPPDTSPPVPPPIAAARKSPPARARRVDAALIARMNGGAK